jgi:serine/threonine protein phosphatase PrpC
MQGWRRTMEDAHTVIGSLPELPDHSFVAVYDGHGGSVAAELAGGLGSDEGEVIAYLRAEPAYEQYISSARESAAGESAGTADTDSAKLLGVALQAAFLAFDAALPPKLAERNDDSGCTAIACLITPSHIVCANAGDSRGCYCSAEPTVANGMDAQQAIPLSYDHKPTNTGEADRIAKAGGSVANGRVDGTLAVSRALGDFSYKDRPDLSPEQQKVSAHPDVQIYRRSEADQLLCLACDGIWDVQTNDDVCAFLRQAVCEEGADDLGVVCEELLDRCLDLNSRDNMSVLVVGFLEGLPDALDHGAAGGLAARRDERERVRQLEREEAAEEQEEGGA